MSFIVILFCECTEFDLTCFVTFVINKKFWIELVKKFFFKSVYTGFVFFPFENKFNYIFFWPSVL